ncbi:MAG: sulfite exporter TauE/SafE family protein [Bacteroidota bacterium]
MIEALQSFGLSPVQWGLLALCAMIVGMSKTGVAGIYNVIIPILAVIFGAQDSTGVLLPILILADIFGVLYYSRSARWADGWGVLPWAVGGVILGTLVGDNISDEVFGQLMAVIVLGGLGLMLWLERRKSVEVPDNWWFAALMGLLAGFTTMVGNVAGPVMVVYLLAMQLEKNDFIGTNAWFFMLINLTKLPFHIFVWKTISVNSVILDLAMLPAIALGAVLGVWIVKRIPVKIYRTFVIAATVVSALLLFIR